MMGALIRLRGLSFSYQAARSVLDGLDFDLTPGERVGLVGATGSGKTTLLHLIVGLIQPAAGSIEAFGRARRTEHDFWDVRARAALLFQDPDDQLFCPTVAEDVAFGPMNLGRTRAESEAIVEETLAALGLAGYENRITHHLSGGEKRLVSLATILAMQPQALLLDEPTTGLDAETRERVVHLLDGLPTAMLIVSHDANLLRRIATRTVALAHGRLAPSAAALLPVHFVAPPGEK